MCERVSTLSLPEQRIELTEEQAKFLEKLNPCHKERHIESSRPGELLSAGTFPRRL